MPGSGSTPPGGRPGLGAACGGDDDLRTEVGRLLAQDERADRVGLDAPRRRRAPPPDWTASWSLSALEGALAGAGRPPQRVRTGRRHRRLHPEAGDRASNGAAHDLRASGPRAGDRVLPMIHILILAGVYIFETRRLRPGGPAGVRPQRTWRSSWPSSASPSRLLWSRWPIPLAGLKALELGMVGVLAGLFASKLYWVMLESSIRGDLMRAQFVLKNIVLLTSVLILTYGLYVPKSWRRAAVVVGPLSLLPFATLAVLGSAASGGDGMARRRVVLCAAPAGASSSASMG